MNQPTSLANFCHFHPCTCAMAVARRGRKTASEAAAVPVAAAAAPASSPVRSPRASSRSLRNKSGEPVIVAAPSFLAPAVPPQPELVPLWARIWLAVSIVLVVWDAAFVLLRPHSFYPSGSLGARAAGMNGCVRSPGMKRRNQHSSLRNGICVPHFSPGWIWMPYEKYSSVDLLYGPAYYAAFLEGKEVNSVFSGRRRHDEWGEGD